MRRGRLTNKGQVRRDGVETAMMLLHAMLTDVDELMVRNQQAMRRTALVAPVLEPAVDRLHHMRAELRLCQRHLSGVWSDGEAQRWIDDGVSAGGQE